MRTRINPVAQAQAAAAAREQATRDQAAEQVRSGVEYLMSQAAACIRRNPRRAFRLLRTATKLAGTLV